VNPGIETSVVTITYNEAENIEEFIRATAAMLRDRGKPFEIIVVDDESPDGTAAIVEHTSRTVPEARVVVRRGERGIGSAYLHGIRASQGRYVVTMDADLSHPPDRLNEILTLAESGSIALGSRFTRHGDFVTHWYRGVVTRGINLWHRVFLGTGLHDHTNGYMAVARGDLERVLEEGDRIRIRPFDRILYVLPIVVLAGRLGFPIREVAAKYVFRTHGETKIPILRGVKLLWEEWTDSLRLRPHVRPR
jgi:dolichol-phosphate mannosyltransferase